MRTEAKASGRIIFLYEKAKKGGENVNGYRYLTLADRTELEALYLKGERVQDIADQIGVHVATVYKELKRGDTGNLDRNMRREYSATLAQRRLAENFRKRGRRPEENEQLETVKNAIL
jgi:IS30 family transposase